VRNIYTMIISSPFGSSILNVRDMNTMITIAPSESQYVNIVPSDDVGDSKIVEDVHVQSDISSVVEDTLIDLSPPIPNEILISSEVLLML